MPCDDFNIRKVCPIKVHRLADNWTIFKHFWKAQIQSKCPGCLWNTHIDAHLIKEGSLPFSDYVHTK
jgi:hypothetical protein